MLCGLPQPAPSFDIFVAGTLACNAALHSEDPAVRGAWLQPPSSARHTILVTARLMLWSSPAQCCAACAIAHSTAFRSAVQHATECWSCLYRSIALLSAVQPVSVCCSALRPAMEHATERWPGLALRHGCSELYSVPVLASTSLLWGCFAGENMLGVRHTRP